jgi:hypothetical protein
MKFIAGIAKKNTSDDTLLTMYLYTQKFCLRVGLNLNELDIFLSHYIFHYSYTLYDVYII